jgi:hypothetical protein
VAGVTDASAFSAADSSARPSGVGAVWRWALAHPVLVAVVTALLVRLVYLAQVRTSPGFRVPLVDAETYVAMARAIAAGDLWGGRTAFWQAPLYP